MKNAEDIKSLIKEYDYKCGDIRLSADPYGFVVNSYVCYFMGEAILHTKEFEKIANNGFFDFNFNHNLIRDKIITFNEKNL